jgi:hypothetical protein
MSTAVTIGIFYKTAAASERALQGREPAAMVSETFTTTVQMKLLEPVVPHLTDYIKIVPVVLVAIRL